MLSRMIDLVHLALINEYAPGLIADKSIVLPRVPQIFDDLYEFIGVIVTFGVIPMLLAAEIQRGSRIGSVTTFQATRPLLK